MTGRQSLGLEAGLASLADGDLVDLAHRVATLRHRPRIVAPRAATVARWIGEGGVAGGGRGFGGGGGDLGEAAGESLGYVGQGRVEGAQHSQGHWVHVVLRGCRETCGRSGACYD